MSLTSKPYPAARAPAGHTLATSYVHLWSPLGAQKKMDTTFQGLITANGLLSILNPKSLPLPAT